MITRLIVAMVAMAGVSARQVAGPTLMRKTTAFVRQVRENTPIPPYLKK